MFTPIQGMDFGVKKLLLITLDQLWLDNCAGFRRSEVSNADSDKLAMFTVRRKARESKHMTNKTWRRVRHPWLLSNQWHNFSTTEYRDFPTRMRRLPLAFHFQKHSRWGHDLWWQLFRSFTLKLRFFRPKMSRERFSCKVFDLGMRTTSWGTSELLGVEKRFLNSQSVPLLKELLRSDSQC